MNQPVDKDQFILELVQTVHELRSLIGVSMTLAESRKIKAAVWEQIDGYIKQRYEDGDYFLTRNSLIDLDTLLK